MLQIGKAKDLSAPLRMYVYTKFNKDWFSHSKFNKGDTQTTQTCDDCMSLLLD
jgi:hypothetical protein